MYKRQVQTNYAIADHSEVIAFDRTTKVRDTSKDFSHSQLMGEFSQSTRAVHLIQGIHVQGTTMYLLINHNFRLWIRAYNLSTKAREPSKDFRTPYPFSVLVAYELWGEDDTLYACINQGLKYLYTFGAYAWERDTGARKSSEDLLVSRDSDNLLEGLTGTENTMWFMRKPTIGLPFLIQAYHR